jgi:hypothetical protein
MAIRNWLHRLAVAVVPLLATSALSLQLQSPRATLRPRALGPYQLCRTTLPETKFNVRDIPFVRYTHAIKHRPFQLSFSATDAGDFDAFMDELDIDKTLVEERALEETNTKVPSHFIQGKADVGIGGNSGFTYDVNALKRNLVQESVRGCKQELLVLLGDGRQYSDGVLAPRWRRDRDDLIEERLSALVQVCFIRLFILLLLQTSSFMSLMPLSDK